MSQALSSSQPLSATELVPDTFQVQIGKCNSKVDMNAFPYLKSCKIIGEILKNHPLKDALTLSATSPTLYLQQFWYTKKKEKLVGESSESKKPLRIEFKAKQTEPISFMVPVLTSTEIEQHQITETQNLTLADFVCAKEYEEKQDVAVVQDAILT
nr:hypothetical protein [Tanacetum cinerariifolium]